MSGPLHSDQSDPTMTYWPKPPLRSLPTFDDDVRPDVLLSDVVSELKSARRGRGVLTSRVDQQIGRTLRTLAEVRADDGPLEIRVKVVRWLCDLADDLPADLRSAALTAFAVAPDARQRLYKDRVELVAKRIGRDARTARRRIDDAVEQLAQRATAKPGCTGLLAACSVSRPRITELRLSLALDRPRPELVEHCRFTADRDGVDEIALFTHRLAGFAELTADQLTTAVLYGGVLDPNRTDQGHPVLRLPRPLHVDESHEYVVRSVLRQPDLLPRQLRFDTDHHCDEVDLRVRFDRAEPPVRVESIGDVRVFQPDEAGEVLATFAGLPPGQGHGLSWE